jgi:hypothetical protein
MLKGMLALFLVSTSGISSMRNDDPPAGQDSVATNLSMYQRLIDSAIVDLAGNAFLRNTATPVIVVMKGKYDTWFVGQSIGQSFQRLGFRTYIDSSSVTEKAIRLEVMPVLSVVYGDPERDGFLGPQKVRRTVKVELTYQLIDAQSHEVLASGTVSKEAADFVHKDSIDSLQNDSIPSTKAVVPDDSNFDRIIAPLFIIGAAGTAVYLFFHVRS